MDLATQLDRARRELLDLTARNRLIHTPRSSRRSSRLEIVDERSDPLFDLLVRKGKPLRFDPRPGPATEETPALASPAGALSRAEAAAESADGGLASGGESSDPDDAFHQGLPDEEDDEEVVSEGDFAARHLDDRLQTALAGDKLQSRLLKLFYDARTAEEEQGVNILYLALGFLRWREADHSKPDRYAPLVLVPVELRRSSANSRFRLVARDEDLVTNLSIQARLRQDFGIELPDLPEDVKDDAQWTPSAYFAQVRAATGARDGWEVLENDVVLWFFSFSKFLMFRDLQEEAWPEDRRLSQRPLIRGLLADGFAAEPLMFADAGSLDEALSPADVVHVADADSSQAAVIAEVNAGRNLVVQGPPGTGKSQTITNLVAAAVSQGRRVLFVAEKRAALEVVKRRLDTMGLGSMVLELHSHKARKREVLSELAATLEAGAPKARTDDPEEALRSAAARLTRHAAELHRPLDPSPLTPYQAMGRLLALRRRGFRAAEFQLPAAVEWDEPQYAERVQRLDDWDRLLAVLGNPSQHPWRGARCSPLLPAQRERLVQRLRALHDRVTRLRDAESRLAELLGRPPAETLLEISHRSQLAQRIRRIPATADRRAMAADGWANHLPAARQLVEKLRRLNAARADLNETLASIAWETDVVGVRRQIAAHGRSWLRFFRGEYRRAIAELRGICVDEPPRDHRQRLERLDRLIDAQRLVADVATGNTLGAAVFGELWRGEATSLPQIDPLLAWIDHCQTSKELPDDFWQMAAGIDQPPQLAEALRGVAAELKEVDGEMQALIKELDLDLQEAFEVPDPRLLPLRLWQERAEQWIAAPEGLSHFLAYAARRSTLQPMGLAGLTDAVDSGAVKPGTVVDLFHLAYCEAILAAAWQRSETLAQFHGVTHEEIRQEFQRLDQQRIGLSRLDVARRHHDNLPLVGGDSGQVRTVRREIKKKRRHLPIRKLLKEAGHAVQRIKPVFMMSPLSVAQYLEPGAVEFDLLVIDEASQVEPVDALGAVARCHQLVIVGDPQQLPPTGFFGRMAGDETHDGEAAFDDAGDLESILGLCEAQGLPRRLLRWHYRSRHESLIAVSNRQFYDDRLFIIPSPLRGGGPLGLRFHFVEDGCYDRGGSATNRPEAVRVVDAVFAHARQTPELSLGVAAFSTRQRDAILDEIELRRRQHPELEDFFQQEGAEPFFVKNLENVQGDERDVILISVGYGRDAHGCFAHNFGPLNREGGHRRLNVLISRAKSRCEVFSSIRADEIDLAKARSEGVAALKIFLRFAETGRLEDERPRGGEADSVFEQQVAAALTARGWRVDHQIGVGGFFVDLAIIDPDKPGRYLLGIECDGAQYHAARWVRDRDRIRQQVLEDRGWIIHRIWSTDWFQRPEEQLDRVEQAIAAAQQHWQRIDDDAQRGPARLASRSTVPEVDLDALWERDEETAAQERVADGLCEYVEADFQIRGGAGGINDRPVHQLAAAVHRIVQIEGPIHLEEVARRLIKILDNGRLTQRTRDSVEAAAQWLVDRGKATLSGAFLDRPQRREMPIRNRRTLENANLRKVDYLPPAEIAAAIFHVAAEHIGTSVRETQSAVAKLLGVGNTAAFRSLVREELQSLVAERKLEERRGQLFPAADRTPTAPAR